MTRSGYNFLYWKFGNKISVTFTKTANNNKNYLFSKLKTFFCKTEQDLVAVISGGAEVTRGLQENITLKASLSYDPEDPHSNRSRMNFTWHYGKITADHSRKQVEGKANKGFPTTVNESAIYYNGTASGETMSLNKETLSPNQTYIVKLEVTKDTRISTVYQVIHLLEGDPPKIYQRLGISFVFCSFWVIRIVFAFVYVAVVYTSIYSWPCFCSLFSLLMPLLSFSSYFLTGFVSIRCFCCLRFLLLSCCC